MKNLLYLITLGMIILISGCVGGVAGKDCGTDVACLESAATACDPAFGTVSLPAGNATMKMRVEIQSGTKDMCAYYFKVSDVVLPQDASAQDQMIVQIVKGKEMTCKKAAGSLFTSNSFTKNQCSGQLADVMLQSTISSG